MKTADCACLPVENNADDQNKETVRQPEQVYEEIAERFKSRFHDCDELEKEIDKRRSEQAKALSELRITDESIHWADIEKNYSPSMLKVSDSKDAASELQKKVRAGLVVVGDGMSDIEALSGSEILTAEDNTTVQLFTSPDNCYFTYLGLRSPKDQVTRIYDIGKDLDATNYMTQDIKLVSVYSLPFLDTTAVYVQLLMTESYSSDYSSGHTERLITWVFASDKHRKLGFWNEYEIDRSWTADENIDECYYYYTEHTASFDGQITVNTVTNQQVKNTIQQVQTECTEEEDSDPDL